MKKGIAILGSTGSIGKQTLEVMELFPDKFQLEVLTANHNYQLLIEQAIKFRPNAVVIGQDCYYSEVSESLQKLDIKVYAGEEAIVQIVAMDSVHMVLVAMVGFSGLQPTINAIREKKQIALANKECLVVAGDLISRLIVENRVSLIPVDSEHSAIFQCLTGENPDTVEKIILTASGGPFRNLSKKKLMQVKKQDALAHPNWDMGDKITVDSASMMNKGLEVIEAKWLFGLDPKQIEVVIHPQSIIHSLVQFRDGSIKAQMGMPDMRLPIQYALSFPDRLPSSFPRFNFIDYKELTFEQPDIKKFRNLALAFDALEFGGNKPCVLNAANEEVVRLFLEDQISFLQMPETIEKCLETIPFIEKPSLSELIETDRESRMFVNQLLNF